MIKTFRFENLQFPEGHFQGESDILLIIVSFMPPHSHSSRLKPSLSHPRRSLGIKRH